MAITYHAGRRLQGTSTDVAVVSNRGTIDTTSSSGNTIITFTGNGTFTPTSSFNVQYLVVGGGGGGGAGGAAGGGAGGFKTATGFAVTPQNYDITVGAGGAGGGIDTNENGSKGSDSIFSTITSEGGGYGSGDSGASVGGNGGSGGGGGKDAGNGNNKGSGTSGQGYNGGDGALNQGSGYSGSGGGGGSSAVGSNGNAEVGGNGGAGTANPISGSTAGVSGYLAGGGGGSGASGNGSGGSGGGGAGTWTGNVTGVAGTVNTGSGGGGCGEIVINNGGGAGGSGIVIIKFATSGNTYSTSAGGKPTDIQVGSRFEETDTRKMYYYNDPNVLDHDFTESGSTSHTGNGTANSVEGWTTNDYTYSKIDGTNDRLDFRSKGDGTNDSITYDLGSALSDSAWLIRFELTFSTLSSSGLAPGVDRNESVFGVFSSDYSSGFTTAQDSLGFMLRIDRDGTDRFYVHNTDGGGLTGYTSGQRNDNFTTTTYYVQMKRTSSTAFEVKFYDSTYTTEISGDFSSSVTVPSTVTGLRYFGFKNSDNYNYTGDGAGYINNVKIYDGVTSPDNAWEELGT